jgi:hypothetical protein
LAILGFSPKQAHALQPIAFDQLNEIMKIAPNPLSFMPVKRPQACSASQH